MPKVSTTLSIDADVKAQAQSLFADLGLDLSTAVNLFFRQCIYEKGIPFRITRQMQETHDSSDIEMTDDEKIDFVAQRILREHKAAFLELAKG